VAASSGVDEDGGAEDGEAKMVAESPSISDDSPLVVPLIGGAANTVSAESSAGDESVPVAFCERVEDDPLHRRHKPPASGSSPPQFGHFMEVRGSSWPLVN